MMYDAIIIGGGAAGLSAALVLGRCRRSVVVLDAGSPRNFASQHVHNYLTRDGIHPSKLLESARRDMLRYGAEFRRTLVTRVVRTSDGFRAHTSDRRHINGRLLLLATGVVDILPAVPDLTAFYGRGVHHCPYCDAFEYSGRSMAAYGHGRAGLGLAFSLRTWSKRIVILTNGERLAPSVRREAAAFQFRVREERITGLRTARGKPTPSPRDRLAEIHFVQGPPERIDAMFFNTGQIQRSDIPVRLGCEINEDGGVVRDRRQRTRVPGLFLAGDASADVQFVIVAAAEGAKAGVAMNRMLQDRECERVRDSCGLSSSRSIST